MISQYYILCFFQICIIPAAIIFLCHYVESICINQDTTKETLEKPLMKIFPKTAIFTCKVDSFAGTMKYESGTFQCNYENNTYDLGGYPFKDDKIDLTTLLRQKTFNKSTAEVLWQVNYNLAYFNQITFDGRGYYHMDGAIYSNRYRHEYYLCKWPQDVELFKSNSFSKYVILFYNDSAFAMELLTKKQDFWETDMDGIEIISGTKQFRNDSQDCPKELINNFVFRLFIPKYSLRLMMYSDCSYRPVSILNLIHMNAVALICLSFTLCFFLKWVINTIVNYSTLRKLPKIPQEKSRFLRCLTKETTLAYICNLLEFHNITMDEQLFLIIQKVYSLAQREPMLTEELEDTYVDPFNLS